MPTAPRVREAVGIDVSEPSLDEVRALARNRQLTNLAVHNARADDLVGQFGHNAFDKVFCVDVYEHLHPEDGEAHLAQALEVLRPGGMYVLVAPNRHTGPSDITRQEFPHVRQALGFHLNEPTLAEIVGLMRSIGFRPIRSFAWFNYRSTAWLRFVWPYRTLVYPLAWSLALERLLAGRAWIRENRLLIKLLLVSLIAGKPQRVF